jgi:transposase InsO family protein
VVRYRGTQPSVGDRHHLHPHAPRRLYLAVVVVDLFSRQVIGWSMQPLMHTDPVLKALTMALWRRRRRARVMGAFGSRLSVHQRGVGALLQGAQPALRHEPSR